jgi:preprotein translocase subunit YajC
MSVVVLVVLMGALYAFMILPQQKRMKAHTALLKSLEEGDIVVTNAGIYGAIAEVDDNVVWLEVAPDVELKISKSAITDRVSDDDEDGDDEDEGGDELVEADSEDGDV